MEFSEKVERELDTLQQSAVAYVGAGAREEGEVMGVVSSLRTNSREICEQVRTYIVSVNCPTQRTVCDNITLSFRFGSVSFKQKGRII